MDMGPMGSYLLFSPGGSDMAGGIMTKPAEVPHPAIWLSIFIVPNIDDAVRRVTDNGGQVLNGPMEVPGRPSSSRAPTRRAPRSRSSVRADGARCSKGDPHRQSRRDRLSRHPHGAQTGRALGRGLLRCRCRGAACRDGRRGHAYRRLAGFGKLSARRQDHRGSTGERRRRSIQATASCRRTPISSTGSRRPGWCSSARRRRRSAPWA